MRGLTAGGIGPGDQHVGHHLRSFDRVPGSQHPLVGRHREKLDTARWRGLRTTTEITAVTGADLVPRLAEAAARSGKSIYFLGGQGDVGLRAARFPQACEVFDGFVDEGAIHLAWASTGSPVNLGSPAAGGFDAFAGHGNEILRHGIASCKS